MSLVTAKAAAWAARHIFGAGNLLSLGVAGCIAWAAYGLVIDNSAPIAIDSAEVLNAQPVPRLDVLKIRYRVTVYRACVGEGRRVFIDAAGVAQPTTSFRTDSGERADGQKPEFGEAFDDTIQVTVPNGSAPGHATYQGTAVFYCNIWQHLFHRGISFDYPAVGFEIGDKTLPAVVPSTSLFRHKSGAAEGLAIWMRHRVGLVEE